jgi:hypothetical protein
VKYLPPSLKRRRSLREAARIIEPHAGGIDAVMLLMALLLLKRANDQAQR